MEDNFQQKCLSGCIYFICSVLPILMAFLTTLAPFEDLRSRNILFIASVFLTLGITVYVYIKKIFENTMSYALFFIVLFSAICLRIIFFPHIGTDYNNFLSPWIKEMQTVGWPWQIVLPITNYNLLYTYILTGISYIHFSDLYLIKAISVLFDCILSITILAILKRSLRLNDWSSLLGFTLAIFAPSIFFNSAAWGQCDSIYVAFLMLGIYMCLSNAPYKGAIFFGLAFSMKLQAVFIFPILLFFILYKQLYIRHLFMIPLVSVILALPAIALGRSVPSIITIYFNQIGTYPSLSNGAPTFWAIFPKAFYDYLCPVALGITGIITFLFTFGTLLTRPLKDKADFWDIAFIYALIIPYFLPKMHERYFYMAVIFSIIYCFNHPKLWFLSFGVILVDLFSYMPFLLGTSVIELKWLSLILLFIIIKIVLLFFNTKESQNIGKNLITPLQEKKLFPVIFHRTRKTKFLTKIIFKILCILGICCSVIGTIIVLNPSFNKDKMFKSEQLLTSRLISSAKKN